MAARQGGKVKWFDNAKGYGFIVRDDGVEVFVHYRQIRMEGYKTLEENQRVEFETQESPKGLLAAEVKVVRG